VTPTDVQRARIAAFEASRAREADAYARRAELQALKSAYLDQMMAPKIVVEQPPVEVVPIRARPPVVLR
jgi:hypothetical protein